MGDSERGISFPNEGNDDWKVGLQIGHDKKTKGLSGLASSGYSLINENPVG
jgi:hypothetical protein